MLILELKNGDSISLFDKATSAEIGQIKKINPRPSSQNKILLGFDFGRNIQITRNSLIRGKDTVDGDER